MHSYRYGDDNGDDNDNDLRRKEREVDEIPKSCHSRIIHNTSISSRRPIVH